MFPLLKATPDLWFLRDILVCVRNLPLLEWLITLTQFSELWTDSGLVFYILLFANNSFRL